MTSPPATAHPTSGRAPADPWPAPLAAAPVNATVPLPGSKSQTNRALVLAALAEEPSRLTRPLRARDTLLMAAGLRSLGVVVDEVALAPPTWRVTPAALRGPAAIDCGLAGTVMRFLPPVATLARGNIRIDGDPRARQRPLRPLLEALRTLGADLDDGGDGALPLTVHGHGRLPGGEVTLDASSSSQLVSGLLLAAPRFDRGVTVRHVGPPVPSQPHLDMTVDMLDTAGAAAAQIERGVWTVTPGPLRGLDVAIEPDLSNAAPFLAAALVTGGEVRIPDWPTSTRQPGAQLVDLLAAMGAAVVRRGPDLSVRGTGTIHGIDADLRDVSELTPVIAAVAALADSPSYLRGIGHLRGHETDRLAALATELSGLGGDVTETADGLRIRPRRLRGGVFATYDDHRLATAAAVVGLVVPGVLVVDVATTAKTLPDFVERWARMLGAGR